MRSSAPMRTPKLQLAAEQPLTGESWIPPKKRYVNHELPDVQAGFRKGRGTRVKLPTSAGSWKKQESSRKTSISALLTMPKL